MTNVSFRISWKISLLFKKMLNHLDFFIFVPLPCCSWADWCALVRKRQSCRSGTVNILYQRPPPLKFIAQGRDALCWRQPTHEIWMLPAYEPHPQSGKVLWFWLPKMALWGQFYGVGGYPLTEKVCSVLVALLNWSSIWMDQNIDEAIKSGHKALLLMYIDHSNLFRNWLLLAFMSLATPARSWGLLMSSCIWLIRQRCKKAVTKETLSP